nr:LysR family transcriptional regulator [uncultured Merdimonas sp.]
MLFRQMKYFVAVVECNSFTEAARQCYISQSAVSQQIRALEEELGVELIHRENRRFSLTPAGEYFYNQSKGLLSEVEDIRRETIRIGQDAELQLRIGYLRCYSGQELHQAVAEFSRIYPEVAISIVNGTHEELYDLLRFGGVDLILNDQRRAFSDQYANYQLLRCGCYAEISARNPISSQESVELEELKHISCILISSREQQNTEEDYFKNTLGFGGRFLFAENLEEGRLMVAGGRGFLPVESVGTLPPPSAAIRRLPIMQNGQQLQKNYCLFWIKEHSNYYIEEFAQMLRNLLKHSEEK